MSPRDQAKSDLTALLGGLTYLLRRLSSNRDLPMLNRIEMDECIALARWMDNFEPGPDVVVDVDFRTRPWYEIPNLIRMNEEKRADSRSK